MKSLFFTKPTQKSKRENAVNVICNAKLTAKPRETTFVLLSGFDFYSAKKGKMGISYIFY